LKGSPEIVDFLFQKVVDSHDSSSSWRDHLGMSQINHECERKLYYDFHWYSKEERSGRMLRLLNRGTQEEPNFYALLRNAGFKIRVRPGRGAGQFRFIDPDMPSFQGSLDGYIISGPGDVLQGRKNGGLELKTAKASSFREFSKKGIEAKSPTYYGQAQSYMLQSHYPDSPVPPLNWFLFLILNKDTDDLYAEIIEIDPYYGRSLKDRAHEILSADGPKELGRLSESPDWYECRWCSHRDQCHFNDAPAKNCRTCKHSKHVQSNVAKWECSKKNEVLFRDAALKGCDEWERKP
jgi:hypothetical protein